MSYVRELNAEGLYHWAARSVAELSHRREEINALNVFPVPDSDTGSNMAFTMEAALEEAQRGGEVADALARGAVRGARGNSGLVLSQVLRAVAESSDHSVVDAAAVKDALDLAVRLVGRAIAEPVEGTIITVLRAAAEAAAGGGDELHPLLVSIVDAARRALAETPSQLAALREAGVVDAGGAGLVVLLECLLSEVEGTGSRTPAVMTESSVELEVVFFFEGDVGALEDKLSGLGNSLVVARDTAESGRVHIHSTQAGLVIETAFASGAVSNLRIEVLPPVGDVAGRIFAVAPDGPIADLFASVGAVVVDPATTQLDTSAEDLFLANGHPCEPGAARLVPTDSYLEGIAAISVYDPASLDLEPILVQMREAARSMRWRRLPNPTPESVAAAAADLLAEGGERVTILCPHPLDTQALAAQLGVEVEAFVAPGIDTEIGVE